MSDRPWKLASGDNGEPEVVIERFDAASRSVVTIRIPVRALKTPPLTATEIGRRLGGYDRRTIQSWIAKGALKAWPIGPKWRLRIDVFGPEAMLEFLEGAVADRQEPTENDILAG